jgi:hypothetical protein
MTEAPLGFDEGTKNIIRGAAKRVRVKTKPFRIFLGRNKKL